MAVTFLQQQSGGSDGVSTTIASAAGSTTSGSLIVGAACCIDNTPGTFSVSDTAGNTYSYPTARNNGAVTLWMLPFYSYNATGNASNVVTANFGASVQYRSIVWCEYSGLVTDSSVYEDEDWDTTGAADAALATPTLSLSDAGLVVGFVCPYDTRTFTTTRNERYDSGTYRVGAIDRIEATAGSYDLDATLSSNVRATLIALAFKAAAGPSFIPRGTLLGVG